ncbi:mitochondrial import inner membrane translocase subunit Tim54 [Cercophora scortea]|uniref:Mitochondrial import inner membrane translocase subunit TIM54 n=1 Tax=Cercophora scortea TaxID=314031 RepID=A0AAE0IF04_9PEZI|nr:mitochondrial import inner membrane translocase subunit Tim54 [Cercophora scortea]
MLGLPNLPKKLPSRNWMIFWTLTTTITGAIIYDRREKKRTIARWAHSVEHLAKAPLPGNDCLAQPRKLTIYLSSPPGDGLRVAQDHYTEYVKPILAASGLDWEFVQGRREGDVRAVVAERVRKVRHDWEGDNSDPDREPTKDEMVEIYRRGRGIPEYTGVRGDVVIGRHTWKEYIRGLHEGWLGPLTPPPVPEPEPLPKADSETPAEDKPAEEEAKPKRPPQPKPYNTVNDYPSESLPVLTPSEFHPAAPVREPHILGFLNTPTRMVRFFNRRALADDIGRQVAAVCLATYREFEHAPNPESELGEMQWEQERELAWEEKDWQKSVWKDEKPKEGEVSEIPERIRKYPIVMDPRIANRMRRFELLPEDEARAREIVVPEEEVEGWTKGNLRQLYRWGKSKLITQKKGPLVDIDDE